MVPCGRLRNLPAEAQPLGNHYHNFEIRIDCRMRTDTLRASATTCRLKPSPSAIANALDCPACPHSSLRARMHMWVTTVGRRYSETRASAGMAFWSVVSIRRQPKV